MQVLDKARLRFWTKEIQGAVQVHHSQFASLGSGFGVKGLGEIMSQKGSKRKGHCQQVCMWASKETLL